jgi:hypothetical protein
MQFLFLGIYLISSFVFLADSYQRFVIREIFPWGHILLEMLGLTTLFQLNRMGFGEFAKFSALIALAISILNLSTIYKYNPNTFRGNLEICLGLFVRILNVFLLYLSSKKYSEAIK